MLGLVVAAAACWLLWEWIRSRGFDWRLFLETIAGLHWGWLAAACVLSLATYYGRALRWAVLMKPVRPRPRLWNLTSATLIGFAAITVFGRPGELVRPYLVARKEDVPLSSQLAALLLERIYDLLAALLLFGFALSRLDPSKLAVGPAMAWVLAMGGRVAAVVGLICVIVLLILRHYSESARKRLIAALSFLPAHLHSRAEKLVTAFVQGAEATRSTRSLSLVAGLTVVEWALIAGSVAALLKAFHGKISMGLVDILVFLGFVAFGAVIQIPGIGGGFQVVAALVLVELFGVNLEVATSVAMVLWAMSFVLIVPIGAAVALREGVNFRNLKNLGREAETQT